MTASGFDSQVAYAIESPFGTFVNPTRAIEHVKFGLKSTRTDAPSKGVKAGRRGRVRMLRGREVVAGPISHELSAANIAQLGVQIMGAVATTGAGPYQHVLTPGPLVERGVSIQGGVPDLSGTIRPLNFVGCQVASGTITVKGGAEDAVMLDLDWVGTHMQNTADGDVVAALVTAVYSSTWAPFTGLQAVLTIDGAEYEFDEFTFKFDNGLRTGDYKARSAKAGQAKVSKEMGIRTHTATIKSDFFDLTVLNRAFAGAEVALSLALSNGTHSFTIAGNVHTQVESISVEGTDIPSEALVCEFLSSTSDAAGITITVVNADATP